MGSCGTCTSGQSSILSNSKTLYNNLPTHFHGQMTTLLKALDQVDMVMRMEGVKVDWRPNNFQSRITPYKKAPRGTEVVVKPTALYFENNQEFANDFIAPGVEGGICGGGTLCSVPEAHKVPGNSYQTFTWSMKETAFETPVFCLKDLAFYENGFEELARFLKNVQQIPSMFYDNYIRNELWDVGEKYFLAATDYGLLWNTPDRLSARVAPNRTDYLAAATAGTGDIGTPRLEAFPFLQSMMEDLIGDDCTDFRIKGASNLMMVGVKEDILSLIYHNYSDGLVPFINGGAGFHMFDLQFVDKFPFAFKTDKKWFRGDFDADGNFYRIPAKVYVQENGGMTLRTNPDWHTARYGVMSFMSANPLIYRSFDKFPAVPGQVPAEATKYLRPSFEWVPLQEQCNYTRGLVSWRAEEEFGFQPSGEKVIHMIYSRDELSSYIRAAKTGDVVGAITLKRADIPETCAAAQVLGCCPAPGAILSFDQVYPAEPLVVDFRDTSYTVSYSESIDGLHGIDLADLAAGPVAAKFATLKGVFDVYIVSANSTGTLITFYVTPSQHTGMQFCCEDQLLGFVASGSATPKCTVLIDNGLRTDPYNHLHFHVITKDVSKAAATEDVTVLFDNGCGVASQGVFTVESVDVPRRRLVISVNPADFPNGVPCSDAVSLCAHEAEDCEDCDQLLTSVPCEGDTVTPIPL